MALRRARRIFTAFLAVGFSCFPAGTAGAAGTPLAATTTTEASTTSLQPLLEDSSVVAGGGSSFAGIEMEQWTDDVSSLNPPIEISYTPSSSGVGRSDFREGTYPYAVSDIAYQGAQAGGDTPPTWPFDYIPIVAGGLGFMYNLPGNPPLNLTPTVACEIFTGEITTWNDKAIADLNPNVTLPSTPIVPVVRSDDAGTSWVLGDWCMTEAPSVWDSFVNYVNSNPSIAGQTSPPVGLTTPSSAWPVLEGFQAYAGDSGTAAVVGSDSGTGDITYVEPEYAKTFGDKPVASVENASNQFTQPTPENVAGALAYATGQSDGIQQLNFGGTGCNVYNPSTYSYMLIRTDTSQGSTGYGQNYDQTVGGFLNYVLTYGEKEAPQIDYADIGLTLEQDGINQAKSDLSGYPAMSSAEVANFALGDVTPSIVQQTACGAAFNIPTQSSTTTSSSTTSTTAAQTTTTGATGSGGSTTTTTAASTTHEVTTTRPGSYPTTTSSVRGATKSSGLPTTTVANTTGVATTALNGAATSSATTSPGSQQVAGSTSTTVVTNGLSSAGATGGDQTATTVTSAVSGAQPTIPGGSSATTTAVSTATTLPSTDGGATTVQTQGNSGTTPVSSGGVVGGSATTAPSLSPSVQVNNTAPDASTGGQQVLLLVVGASVAGVSELARRRIRKAQ